MASASAAWLSVGAGAGALGDGLALTADPTGLPDGDHLAVVTLAPEGGGAVQGTTLRVGLHLDGAGTVLDQVEVSRALARTAILDPVRPYVYVLDDSAQIAVFDTLTGAAVRTLAVPGATFQPFGVVISPDGAVLWVEDYTGGRLIPIDLDHGTVGAPLPSVPALSSMRWLRLDGHDFLVASTIDARVLLIDPATGTNQPAPPQPPPCSLAGALIIPAAHALLQPSGTYPIDTLTRCEVSARSGVPVSFPTATADTTWEYGDRRLYFTDAAGIRLFTSEYASAAAGGATYQGKVYDLATLAPVGTLPLLAGDPRASGALVLPDGRMLLVVSVPTGPDTADTRFDEVAGDLSVTRGVFRWSGLNLAGVALGADGQRMLLMDAGAGRRLLFRDLP